MPLQVFNIKHRNWKNTILYPIDCTLCICNVHNNQTGT
jgi:hypothetical protein